jgi:mono/diheme cytochrome c family protein
MTKEAAALAATLLCAALAARAAAPVQIMILDGESAGAYHKWQWTTPVLKKALDDTGLFNVDVVTAPPPGGDFAGFRPEFDKYQAIIFNYDAPDDRWPAALKTSFEQYIRSGGGLVVVHAGDNAFPGWRAFNEMIGVGGWRGRNEQAGPMWHFEDGALVADRTPGAAGSHGSRLPFRITVRDANHPITRGLPPVWMHQSDELYAALRGPAVNMTVLATGFSDPANHGSGMDEPLLMAISYGKGRVFHTALGHDVTAMSSVDFIVTLQRGAEWAATGAVTQKVPADFPSATAVSVRRDIAAMDPDVSPADQVRAGEPLFSARCGFCHGRDAAGGEGGTDLTRSALVGEDVRGDRIGALVRGGRRDKGMPAFNLADADLAAIVAYVHDQKRKAEMRQGSRRTVEADDLRTGDARAGKTFFDGAGGCSKCHSPSGDLAGIANRLEGLSLLQRMLYPPSAKGTRRTAPAQVVVTLPSGQTVAGALVHRDEFTIALTDASGWYRSWPTAEVKFSVTDPLDAHAALLEKYTDDDMHDVLAYLQTLR